MAENGGAPGEHTKHSASHMKRCPNANPQKPVRAQTPLGLGYSYQLRGDASAKTSVTNDVGPEQRPAAPIRAANLHPE